MYENENEKKKTASIELPCAVVEDILPLYVDELTNPVTNTLVKNHLNGCVRCQQKWMALKTPVQDTQHIQNSPDNKEIDFLKKTKKHNRKLILSVSAIIFIIACLVVVAKYFIIGNNVNAEYLNYSLDVSGNEMHIIGQTTTESGIQKVTFSESNGVVEISIRSVEKSLFYKSTFDETFDASQDIQQIRIGDQIIWADGEKISPLTAMLYQNYNPYIGDMPRNGKLVSILNMDKYTGGFQNELQTDTEPYGWTIKLANNFSSARKEAFEKRLSAYAYVLLAEVENLGEITYEYTLYDEPQKLTITAEDASAYAGADIKETGKNIVALEKLIRKTELNQYALNSGTNDADAQTDSEAAATNTSNQSLNITVINFAEDEIYSIAIDLDVPATGDALGQGMSNADNTRLATGENVTYQLFPEDFSGEIPPDTKATLTVTVTDADGNTYEAACNTKITLEFGKEYRLNLIGNAKEGYEIEK